MKTSQELAKSGLSFKCQQMWSEKRHCMLKIPEAMVKDKCLMFFTLVIKYDNYTDKNKTDRQKNDIHILESCMILYTVN